MWYVQIMDGTHTVTVGERGRIVVPAAVRERAGFSEGTTLMLLETPDGVVLMTRQQLLARVRGELRGSDLLGELLTDRRRAAEVEDAEMGGAS